jgi:hypothetical protein
MKKQRKDVAPGEDAKKALRRLTLHRETIQHLNDPRLGAVLGGLAAHTFTGGNLINDPGGANGATLCG